MTLCVSACSEDGTSSATPSASADAFASASAATTQSGSPESSRLLTCPGDRTVQTDGGLRDPRAIVIGHPSAFAAVEAWMKDQGGDDYVLDSARTTAWVLRTDGTARARLEVVEVTNGEGWVIQGYKACVSRN